MTFVRVEERVLGITCDHVVRHAEDTGFPAFMLALDKHTPIRMPVVARSRSTDPDFPFDVAAFDLNLEELQRAGKIPLALDKAPAMLEEGEIALAVGFPGYARSILNEREMAHLCCHVAATCQAVSNRRIVLHDVLPGQPIDFSVGGMSGGPIFRIDSSEAYSLAGIISEGKGRVDSTDVGGDAEEIWLTGFPISELSIKRLLEARDVPHNTAPVAGALRRR